MTKPCPPDLAAFKHEPADYEQPVEAVTVEQIEVTQADRELASELLALDGHCFSAELVLEGAVDDWPNVQAIARHRHRTQANEAMREALERISDAHLPDQPATSSLDETEWAIQHIRRIRAIARNALSGDGA